MNKEGEKQLFRARVPTPKYSKQKESKFLSGEGFKKGIPGPYKVRRFYLPSEVEKHNSSDDCWVSLFNQVFDLTQLIAENHASELCDPIILAAGTDISHWFDLDARSPKTFIDPQTNLESTFCPTGRYLHIPPSGASGNAHNEVAKFDMPWWSD